MDEAKLYFQNGKTYLVRKSGTIKYTVKDLRTDFPDEESCLRWLIESRYPDGITCKTCKRVTKNHKRKNRRAYACDNCGSCVSPTANTIFHKSSTSLTNWFYAIWLMSSDKAGTSARQIERSLGVAYPTAWRMMHQIRSLMHASDILLSGEVEIDETFIHPNTFKRSNAQLRYGRDARRTGEVVLGMVQRGGEVKMMHVKTAGARIVQPLIQEHIEHGSLVYTDGWQAYRKLPRMGYPHNWTDHGRGQHVDGDNHTQNIENVWSHLKRGIKGVYRKVDQKYIQLYANEFAWRYSHRKDVCMFWSLIGEVSNLEPTSTTPGLELLDSLPY